MRASCLATFGVWLAVATVSGESVLAQYQFDAAPQLPPLAGNGTYPGDVTSTPSYAPSPAYESYGAYGGPAGSMPSTTYDPSLTVPLDEGTYFPDASGSFNSESYGPPMSSPSSGWGTSAAFDGMFRGDEPVWAGFLSSTYMPGTERTLWNGDLFLPLYQDGTTLWYLNVRGQVDDDDAAEFNIGSGVRTLARPGLIFGTYLFYDRLFSANNNGFSQGTFGVEVMDVCWDYRFNVYFPESKAKPTSIPPKASISDGTIVVNSGEERAYWGLDFEAGALLGAWGPNAQHELRGFAAIYHFDHSAAGYDNITGPRVRLEWRYHDLPMFGSGSRLTCGVTLQTDTERGGDAFAFIGLRVPLDPWACQRQPISRMQRRMLDNVVRDVDVVTNARMMSEPAVNPHNGQTIGSVHVLDREDDLAQLIPSYNDNSVVVIDGAQGDIISRSDVALRPGQLILGGGSQTMVRGATTGRVAKFTAPGTRPTVEFDANYCPNGSLCTMEFAPPTAGFVMADDSSLAGVNVRGGQPGVAIEHVENVRVSDVNLRNASGAAVLINDSLDVNVQGVTIDGVTAAYQMQSPPTEYADVFAEAASSHQGVGIAAVQSRDVTIRDVQVKDVTQTGLKIVESKSVAVSNSFIENTGGPGARLLRTEDTVVKWVEIRNVGRQDGTSPRVELVETKTTRVE
ncbi:MAG: right-handed parallel beta-helix repeat-containing protein [Planctomycetaceae bacterium]|nr:right-handed parallel beta-helix repeat-containing protein [Planctomycetaceae bacterium]